MLICQIEGALSSRLNTAVSDDPRDPYPLTQGMLLNGFKRISQPIIVESVELSLENEEHCPIKRYKHSRS